MISGSSPQYHIMLTCLSAKRVMYTNTYNVDISRAVKKRFVTLYIERVVVFAREVSPTLIKKHRVKMESHFKQHTFLANSGVLWSLFVSVLCNPYSQTPMSQRLMCLQQSKKNQLNAANMITYDLGYVQCAGTIYITFLYTDRCMTYC